MKRTVAVEPALTPVKDFLSEKGYIVKNINFGEMTTKKSDEYDAFVVTGLDKNFLGVNDTSTKAVVVDATGMTPEQIYDELEQRME
ncbi:MAG TPA: YkuS family protein [Clostridia bacterium]|nr:YkuS family protein [Clostridia bacterium]